MALALTNSGPIRRMRRVSEASLQARLVELEQTLANEPH